MYVCKTFFCFCATFIHFDFGHQEMLTMCYIINYVIKQITKELFRYIGNLYILASCIFLTKKKNKKKFFSFFFFCIFFFLQWVNGNKEERKRGKSDESIQEKVPFTRSKQHLSCTPRTGCESIWICF